MKKVFYKICLHKSFGLLLFAIILNGAAAARVSAQRETLADGNPPLTVEMVERYAALMEWSLDVQFERAERQAIEKQLAAYWQAGDQKNIKAVLDTLAFEKKLSAANKQELQPQVKQAVLEALEKDSADSLSALLLEIYRKNVSGTAENSDAGGGDLSQLVGKWQVLHGNSIVTVDKPSGRIGDGNSMIAEYDIKPDGRVVFTFVLQQANYGCTTRVKTYKTGRASFSGSRVTFAYDAGGTTASEDNCNAKYNYTKKLAAERETFDFNLKRDENGKPQFCFASPKLKDCAIKVQ
jgi:hypothetical protein